MKTDLSARLLIFLVQQSQLVDVFSQGRGMGDHRGAMLSSLAHTARRALFVQASSCQVGVLLYQATAATAAALQLHYIQDQANPSEVVCVKGIWAACYRKWCSTVIERALLSAAIRAQHAHFAYRQSQNKPRPGMGWAAH